MPVREQRTAEVTRQSCYLYNGMADIAAEFDDEELKVALNSLFDNIVEKNVCNSKHPAQSPWRAFTSTMTFPTPTPMPKPAPPYPCHVRWQDE